MHKRDPLKEYRLVDGEFVAVPLIRIVGRDSEETNMQFVQVGSREDPKHFGHLIYQYHNLVKLMDEVVLGREPKRFGALSSIL